MIANNCALLRRMVRRGRALLEAASLGLMVLTGAAGFGCSSRAQPISAEHNLGRDRSVRQQAEALAEAASRHFTEILNGDQVAQGSSAPSPAQTPAAGAQIPPQQMQRLRPDRPAEPDRWAPALRWIAHSSQVYRAVMQQLSTGGAPAAVVVAQTPAVAAPSHRAPATDQAAAPGVEAPVEETRDRVEHRHWLVVSSQRFQALMRKLSRRTAPPEPWDPVAEAEKRTGQHKPLAISPQQPSQARPNAGVIVSATGADSPRPVGTEAGAQSIVQPRAQSVAQSVDQSVTQSVVQSVAQSGAQSGDQERPLAVIRRAGADTAAPMVKETQAALQARNAKTTTAGMKKPARTATIPQAAATSAPAKALADTGPAADAHAAGNATTPKKTDTASRAPDIANVAHGKAKPHRRPPGQTTRSRHASSHSKHQQTPQTAQAKSAMVAAATPEPGKTQHGPPTKVGKKKASRAVSVRSAQHISPPRYGLAAAGEPNLGRDQGRHHGRAPTRCKRTGKSIQPPGWYVVKEGDSLWSIAHRHYGVGRRYKRIFAANRKRVRQPQWIYPCQRLYLPSPARRA
jgi:colicin import membrane protein